MNAPSLKINAADESRDVFSAYVCDEATAEILRNVAKDRNWPADRVEVGPVDSAVRALSVAASPRFLVIDLSESEYPRGDINSLAEVCEPGTLVIALGSVNDVNLYRELIASGIQDYLVKPVSEETLRDALEHAEMVLAHSGAGGPEAAVDERHVTAIVGVRGGVGASTLATSCAWIAAHELNKSVALLDLDMHFGTDALAFDLEPGRGLCDALENPSRVDSLFLERATIKESDQLSILGAEAPLSDPMIPDPAALGHLQAELTEGYDVVLIDLPRVMMPSHGFVVSQVTDIVVVSDLSLAAARDTIRVLGFLKENAPDARVHLVANKVGGSSQLELSRKDFEASVERKIDAVIPLDVKSAVAAAKKGRALAAIAKGSSKVGKELRKLADLVGGEANDRDDEGLLAKLLAFKSGNGSKSEKAAG